jgi:hypothetical protein
MTVVFTPTRSLPGLQKRVSHLLTSNTVGRTFRRRRNGVDGYDYQLVVTLALRKWRCIWKWEFMKREDMIMANQYLSQL